MRYFNIPGSRTDRVLDLPNQSNVAVPGRWMFRVDNAKIEGDGCDKKGGSHLFFSLLILSHDHNTNNMDSNTLHLHALLRVARY